MRRRYVRWHARSVRGVAVVTAMVVAAGCSSSTEPIAPPTVLGPGQWGGPSAVLTVTGEGAQVRFDFCADGSIDVPIALTTDGRFDVPGRYVRSIGPGIAAKSARYIGLWRRSSLTIAVILSDPLGPDGSTVVGPFDLRTGDPGPVPRPCPI